jgi:predicted O-linked N-acetylglucosamine transferase (SPINDLY family)
MTSIPEALQAGLEHHRAGRLLQAEQMYRRVLQIHPRHAGAVHLLGLIAFQAGKLDVAEYMLQEAVKIDAFHAPFSADLGEVYRTLGKTGEAIAAYRKALELNPETADAHNNLGTLLQAAGQLDEASECFREALQCNAAHPEAAMNLGKTLQSQGKLTEAETAFATAAKIAPEDPLVYLAFGKCLRAQKNALGAIACFQMAVRLDPDSAQAHYQLGRAHRARGDSDLAAAEYAQALRLAPELAEAHYNLGLLERDRGRAGEALASFKEAARLDPAMIDAHLCLANLYLALEDPDQAVAASRAAVALQGDSPSAAAHLAAALQAQGDLDGAIAAYRRAVELNPDSPETHSNLLYVLNFHPAQSAAQLFAEHRAWAERHAEPLTALASPHQNDRDPERRLRVGYVSAHFREHSVSFFSLPLLTAHDRERFEVFAYSNSSDTDAITEQFQRAATAWRPIEGMSHETVAQQIRDDQIDILVDLTGHSGGNRLSVFARKPAPVQVTYLGYQNTTGMTAMDYRLTDAHADPPGTTDAFYTEKLVRLPGSFFCYRPPEAAPEVNELPSLASGRVTLGWLNSLATTTPEAIQMWSRLLGAVPNAQLVVLAYRPGAFEERVLDAMSAAGIDPARVEIVNWRLPDAYLRLHHRIDIALDSFPFNGHTTICTALWMGVPSVVRQGSTYASRFGGSVLVSLGLGELIARSDEEYIEIVARLAGDLPKLAELRRGLRTRVADSPLVDARAFARHVEHAYRTMWQQWCRGA